MLNDALQRQQAIDPTISCIVQAPAGSGKTELLTQRFLKLLARVTEPEQIIALTFTRKAANEMKERIFHALQQAQTQQTAKSEHHQQTLLYAEQALQQNNIQHWNLLEQPERLRILTIDALCQRLTLSMPLLDNPLAFGKLCDKPKRYYSMAAKNCIEYALEQKEYQSSIKVLLQHLDNRQESLHSLFIDLLSTREQWSANLHHAGMQTQSYFEQGLKWIEHHEISLLRNSLPQDLFQELQKLVYEWAPIGAEIHPLFLPLQNWHSAAVLDREIAKGLAHLLLTTQNTLRKGFDHYVGLKKGTCPDTIYSKIKQSSKELLSVLAEYNEFLKSLDRIKTLPPAVYASTQWEVLQALFQLLPLLNAHLQLVFSEHNLQDFSNIAAQAFIALGEEDHPTDLTLYLDHQIHHLLVDEFQDTSIQQFELLSRLIQGWQAGDGKTLFVVGDPMQSIYRFRAAEVGLFLRAKTQGIGSVALTSLQLTSNFRSDPHLVTWVNQQFKNIFPCFDDIESGAISFCASTAVNQSSSYSEIKAFQYPERSSEAEEIIQLIQNELVQYPKHTIAILVRSRSQLKNITQLLRAHHIPFQGVEIDLLSQLSHLRDAWALTQSLLMPANRMTWLTVMRSPWCGLDLHDIHKIAQFDKDNSILFTLSQLEKIENLSSEGQIRAHYFYNVMQNALTNRGQLSLAAWVFQTMQDLQIYNILTPREEQELEQFWSLLSQFEDQGRIADEIQFEAELNHLFSQQSQASRLQIMTIHKSKGLEFDCIILPGLSSKSLKQDKGLLRWLKLPTAQNDLLLLSPIKAVAEEECALYNYLGKFDSEKNDFELQRLLYVAVTRARKKLYLFDYREKAANGSFRSFLKNQEFITVDSHSTEEISDFLPPVLQKLPVEYYKNTAPRQINREFNVLQDDHLARQTGIIVHEILQWVCTYHPLTPKDIPWELATYSLKLMGFSNLIIPQVLKRIQTQIESIFHCSIGQWIIKAHQEEENELELLFEQQGKILTRIIDRTFYEHGIRWVVDFKTGSHHVMAEQTYRMQLNEYAKLISSTHADPIKCGIYYLEDQHWLAWDFETQVNYEY